MRKSIINCTDGYQLVGTATTACNKEGDHSLQLSHLPFLFGVPSPDRQLNGRIPYPQSPCHLSHQDPHLRFSPSPYLRVKVSPWSHQKLNAGSHLRTDHKTIKLGGDARPVGAWSIGIDFSRAKRLQLYGQGIIESAAVKNRIEFLSVKSWRTVQQSRNAIWVTGK
jgi:hypothetical protein